MNFLSILGSLPASTSVKGKLDGLDLAKTLRVALVALAGAFLVGFAQSVFGHCSAEVAGFCDLSAIVGWKAIFSDALQAGITSLTIAAGELFRRFLAANKLV